MEWRVFEEDDLEWILKVTKDMFDESEWNDGEYDKDKVKSYFYQVMVKYFIIHLRILVVSSLM